ncbi:hypothetical protein OU416_32005 [Saccharopolyspora indica]|nr:hypothetical protein [Saccharopolyspora indica]MDA3648723.1 hypothetical protein [Saccharopolyspora indica]
MGAFDWLFGKQVVPGQAQAVFDHVKTYNQVVPGSVVPMSHVGAAWQREVRDAFVDADAALSRVLKDSEVLMQGGAADQAREAVTPLARATREASEIAELTGKAVEEQADVSADFKNAFPEPHRVPPDNIGWGDYVNPYAFALKSGVRAGHEEVRDQIEAQARQQYEDYARSTNERINGIQQFSPPPKFTADVEPAKTDPVHKVEPTSSHTTAKPEAEQPAVPPVADPGPPSVPDQPAAAAAAPVAPAESGSAWVAPAAGGSPVAGGSAPAPGGAGGVAGGVVVPPGGSGGRPASPGTGRGGGTGTGRGGDTGKGLPGGGRSGSGGGSTPPGSTGSASPAARWASGSGGVAGGAPAAGGRQKEEDKEHGRKFVKGDRGAWSDLEIPKVAPPVFGDWEAEARKGKPPRPPEQT